MKKEYMKPTMNVVKIQHKCQILAGSITGVEGGDTGITGGGPGSGPARARSYGGIAGPQGVLAKASVPAGRARLPRGSQRKKFR